VHVLNDDRLRSRPHVGPILVDVFNARLAAVLLAGDGPAGWNFGRCGPERMLALVVDQHDKVAALVVERIAHVSCSCFEVSVRYAAGDKKADLVLRSGCGRVRVAGARFELCEDLRGDFEQSGHGDGLADSARRTEAIELPTSAPQDSLHSHVNHAGDRA